MAKEISNLSALKVIAVAKGISLKELAKYFNCTQAYFNECANGKKTIRLERLIHGLTNMNIRTSEYFELEEIKEYMIKNEYDALIMYQAMLTKALGMVDPNLKSEASIVVEKILEKNSKHRALKP